MQELAIAAVSFVAGAVVAFAYGLNLRAHVSDEVGALRARISKEIESVRLHVGTLRSKL